MRLLYRSVDAATAPVPWELAAVRVDGDRFRARCAVRFERVVTTAIAPVRAVADGEGGADGEDADPTGPMVVVGTASSTGRDAYGTRMSRRALEGMAEQFRAGVGYLPCHPSWIRGGGEWSDQIGTTVAAELVRGDVPTQVDGSGDPLLLRVTTELWPEREMAEALMEHLRAGRPVGQSIGGWFREISYLLDQDGEVTDVVVEEVELDHLAAVRSPANAESADLAEDLRTALRDRAMEARSADRAPALHPSAADPLPAVEVPEQRTQESEMTPEQIAALSQQLQAAIVEGVRAAMAAQAPAATPAPTAAAPAPATPDDERAQAAEARAAAAEARAAAAEARARLVEAQRSGSQAPTGLTGPAPAAATVAAAAQASRTMADVIREAAPEAWRMAAASRGDIPLTPHLIASVDGDAALLSVAEARGEAKHLTKVLRTHKVLLESPETISESLRGGPVAMDTVEDGVVVSMGEVGSRRSRREASRRLRAALGEVLYAGWRDGALEIGGRGGAQAVYHQF